MPAATPETQQEIAASSHPGRDLRDLPREERRDVFFRLPDAVREEVVRDMGREDLLTFVRHLDPDEATDVLALAGERDRDAVLRELGDERRERLEFLLGFDPETAAGMMDLDYVTVGVGRGLDEVADRVRRHEERTGRFPTILVTDGDELVGELPGPSLGLEEDVPLEDLVVETPAVRHDRPDEDVLDVFRGNPEGKVAVLDEEGAVLGIIHAAEILEAVEEEAGETLYEFTGVTEEESVLDGAASKVRRRYKWLILNLGTAFLAASVVGLFEATIAAFTLLAVYMPIVAGMGGNAGTQSMAVTVRGIALEQVSLGSGLRVVGNEILAGAANGLITGVLVAAVATLVNQSPLLGAVIGTSMVLNLIIAGFFGTIIPLVLDAAGVDPATSATIFITTATDVLGFFIFLGLASLVI